MNHSQSTGVILQIKLPNEAEAKRGSSGLIVIQYGGKRDRRNNAPRQYVNAVPYRVPAKLVKNFRDYKTGDVVELMGRHEGVIESGIGGQTHSVQLIANVISRVAMEDFGYELKATKSAKPNKPPVGAFDEVKTEEETHAAVA